MKRRTTVAFDMDGTIANLYGVENWLEHIRSESVMPYVQAEPLVDVDLFKYLMQDYKAKGFEVKIITWLAKGSTKVYDKEVIKAKKGWLQAYGLMDYIDSIEFLPYGTSKVRQDTMIFDDDVRILEDYNNNQSLMNCKGLPPHELYRMLSV